MTTSISPELNRRNHVCDVSIQTETVQVDQSPHSMGDRMSLPRLLSSEPPAVQCDPCKEIWTASPDGVYQTCFPIPVDQKGIIICAVPVLNDSSDKPLSNLPDCTTLSVSNFQGDPLLGHNSLSQTDQAHLLTLCNAVYASVPQVLNSVQSLKQESLSPECKISLDNRECETGADALSCGYSDSLEDLNSSLPHLSQIIPNIHKTYHVLKPCIEEHL